LNLASAFRLERLFQGTLQEDGSEFDSSVRRGDPLIFTLGTGQVIKGWDQGLLGSVFSLLSMVCFY